jgi:hypothetical protein
VTAINAGAVPVISTAWQSVAESECRRAADEAEAHYTAAMAQAAPFADENTLATAHHKALASAGALFTESAVGDAQVLTCSLNAP